MNIRYALAPLTLAIAAAVFSSSVLANEIQHVSEKDSSAMSAPRDADNTEINQRDKQGSTTLPTDQPNNSADIEVAAAVRSAIVEDDSLSIIAHNVKLVAAGGVVVLRGPVASEAEKAKVAQIAGAVAGVSKVENHLEVNAK